MGKRYGRVQFLRDARALGIPVHLAHSRTALRRQRDCLIREHHPDRGGSTTRAREINDTYARMVKWLDVKHKPEALHAVTLIEQPEPETALSSRVFRKAMAVSLWTATLIASSYIIARKANRS